MHITSVSSSDRKIYINKEASFQPCFLSLFEHINDRDYLKMLYSYNKLSHRGKLLKGNRMQGVTLDAFVTLSLLQCYHMTL